MNNYTEAVANALDHAIAKVARAEFRRLIRLQGKEKAARGIETALRGLEGLQGGAMPEYDDDWLPVLYSTWYQPSHVNLAYSMITAMAERRGGVLAPSGKLHVFDFGCGTLAMQFGVALAVADALQQGQTLTASITSLDVSQKMVGLGMIIWQQFRDEVGGDRHLARLEEACGLMQLFQEPYNPPPEDERWLSALHVVYRDNSSPVRKSLRGLRNGTDPDMGLIAYAAGLGNLVKSAMPFNSREYRCDESDVPLLLHPTRPFTSFSLLETHSARHDLLDHVDPADVEDYNFVSKFLSGDIGWGRPEAKFLIYTRH